MIIKTTLPLLLVLLLAPVVSVGQATITGSPITGDVIRPRVESETETPNALLGAIAVSAMADDNNNNSTVDPIGGSQYYVAPSLALDHTRPHLNWNVGYAPGLRFYVPSSSLPNRLSQSFGGSLHWDLSKRFAIGLRQDYIRTDDPFQQLGEAPLQPGIGLLNRPGDVLISNISYSQLLSQAEVDYRLAKHTSLGVNGSFMQLQSNHPQGGNEALLGTRESSGSVFLSQQFTAKQSIGLQYQLLNMTFQGNPHTVTHGLFVFDKVAFNSRISVTLFAGAQYSRIHNQEIINAESATVDIPVSKALWSPAAGATVSWNGTRTAVDAEAVRRIGSGAGLLSSAEMNDVRVNLRRMLARRWIFNLGGGMMQDTLLGVPGNGQLRIVNASAGISREVTQHMWVRFSYARLGRTGGAQTSDLGSLKHNQLMLTVERSFTWPLGR